jgi:Tol biopolymer transport system component
MFGFCARSAIEVIAATLASVFAFWNGQVLAQQPQTQIMIMDAGGSNPRTVARIDSYTRHDVPRFSPDGHDILFEVSWKVSGEYEPKVYKVAAEGGEAKDMGLGKMPSWSPDGKQIVFRIPPDVGESRAGVWIMNADGTGREYLFPGHQPFFSPDGTRIVYTSEEQNGIRVFDILEGTHRAISQPYSRITGYAAWSVDGKQLCFIGRKESGELELAISAADGSQETPKVVWADKSLARFPSWAPSQNLLLTIRTNGNNDQIYTFDPAHDSQPQALEHSPSVRNFDGSWSPNLKRIVFVSDVPP